MEFCTEYNDGAYFAHLERQILMLMMDEEDEFTSVSPVAASDDSLLPILRKQITSLDSPTRYIGNSPPTITDDCKRLPAYSWELPKRGSSGTGVFIPQIREQNTRKGKEGRTVSARASERRKN